MRSFPALLERKRGTLRVERGRLSFEPEENLSGEKIEIHFLNLNLELGGQNSQQVLVSDKKIARDAIVVQDEAFLPCLVEHGAPSAQPLLEKSYSRKKWRKWALATPIVAVSVLLVGLPMLLFTLPPRFLGKMVSFEQERKWAASLVPDSLREEAGARKERVHLVLDHLVDHNPDLRRYDIQLIVANQKENNAFALPGGAIVLNRGFLEQAQSIEEVAGVLAHELGHVTERHALAATVNQLGVLSGVALLGFIVGGDAASFLAMGSRTLSLKYSRANEDEADAKAVHYLHRAGVKADGLADFLQRVSGGKMEEAVALFSTHPISMERVEHIKSLRKENPLLETGPLPVTLEEIKRPAP